MGQNPINSGALGTILALAIISGYIIKGAKKGFAKTFYSTFGSIISLLLAILLCSSFTRFLESSFGLVTKVSNKIGGALTKMIGSNVMNTTLSQALSQQQVQSSLPSWVFNIVINASTQTNINPNVTLNQIITPVFGFYITNIISIAILFCLFKIIMFVACDIISKMRSIAIIGSLDAILGLALGLIKGIVALQVLLIVLNVMPFTVSDSLAGMFNTSKFVQFIDKINVFELIFDKLSSKSVLKHISSIIK